MNWFEPSLDTSVAAIIRVECETSSNNWNSCWNVTLNGRKIFRHLMVANYYCTKDWFKPIQNFELCTDLHSFGIFSSNLNDDLSSYKKWCVLISFFSWLYTDTYIPIKNLDFFFHLSFRMPTWMTQPAVAYCVTVSSTT